jgi:dipeptidyl aminopeptidase/acylaminoacyl peptidase
MAGEPRLRRARAGVSGLDRLRQEIPQCRQPPVRPRDGRRHHRWSALGSRKKRLGILGGSAGGYAVLRAITERPDMFAATVDPVGPSDLKLLFSTMPAGWGTVKIRWVRRMGDVEHDEALNRRLSPPFRAETIRTPLLIGQAANDPRVNIKNSDLIVAALRKKNMPVTYIVYPDEGHGFARPEDNLDFFGRAEVFLARYLGGRAEPWVKIKGSTAELR